MATATDDRLGQARRRIARLEVDAQQGTSDARSRLQQYIDGVRRAEGTALVALHRRAAAVEESLEQLDNELELATHRVAAELATTDEEFRDAVEAELHRWDVVLGRMQARAAVRPPPDRERAEAVVADLRDRRLAIGEDLSELRTAEGRGWHEARTRVLPQIDELKRRADAASWRHGGDT